MSVVQRRCLTDDARGVLVGSVIAPNRATHPLHHYREHLLKIWHKLAQVKRFNCSGVNWGVAIPMGADELASSELFSQLCSSVAAGGARIGE
jgi:hypothetical protein